MSEDGRFFPSYNAKELKEDAIRESAKHKARFCLATGIAPSEYDNLTLVEVEEFSKELERQNRKK